MAKKEKKPLSKGKKWLIALAVLALIAVVVVIIIVCLPKNTGGVVAELYNQEKTAFLKDEEEQRLYNNFQEKIENLHDGTEQKLDNVYHTNMVINNVLTFYKNNLVFAENNGAFQAEYYTIIDNFNEVNTYQKSLISILQEVESKVDIDPNDYVKGALDDFREVYVKYVSAYSKSFKGLANAFKGSVPEGVINNKFSVLVTQSIPEFLEVISENFDKAYNAISYLKNFTNNYLSDTSKVLISYPYNGTLQEKLEKCYKFSQVYNVSFKDVIKTATSTDFSFNKIEADSDNCLAEVKLFLRGGLSA